MQILQTVNFALIRLETVSVVLYADTNFQPQTHIFFKHKDINKPCENDNFLTTV